MSIATLVPFETGAALAAVPRLRHGFFGRAGGVSTGDYAGLNASESGGDQLEAVTRNRVIASHELGFEPEGLVTLVQVHGNTVITLTQHAAAGGRPEADAVVTKLDGIALGILTADCAPVLLVDAEAGVIGAAHAGWKGALGGVIDRTLAAMCELGAEPRRILAAIGPTIFSEDYEVGETFKTEFLRRDEEAGEFFTTPTGGNAHFDLPAYVESRLRRGGVSEVEQVGQSTYGSPERYYSHRFATHRKGTTGRQISMIGWLKGRS